MIKNIPYVHPAFRKKSFWILAAVCWLNACQGEVVSEPGGKAVVRVNNDEITLRQVEYVLAHLPEGQREDEALVGKIMEQFVDQQLLLQKALENRLDQDSHVMLALEQTRRQILAQAYLDRVSAAADAPAEDEIRAYYRGHPELFAQRRIYRLQQIVASKALSRAELEAMAQGAGGASELIEWLQHNRQLVGVETSLSPAEKISTEILPRLHAMKKGQRLVWETPEHNVVVVLLGSSLQPLSEAQAAPLITKYLSAEKRKAHGQEELARLRQTATIQWLRESVQRPAGFGPLEQEKYSDQHRFSAVNVELDLEKYLPSSR